MLGRRVDLPVHSIDRSSMTNSIEIGNLGARDCANAGPGLVIAEVSMQRATGIMLVTIAAAMLLGGCALRGTRDDYMYSRSSDGLWDADYGLIDWNFPTSQNQPPLEGPKRLRPERTAIGVTWATTDAWPYYHRPAQPADPNAGAVAKADDPAAKPVAASSGAAASKDAAAGNPAPAAGGGNH